MSHACRDIAALIDQRRAGLSGAQRLMLEQHVSECAGCARLSAEMHALTALIDSAPALLAIGRRERVIATALANAQREAVPTPTRKRLFGLVLGASALAAGLALAFLPAVLRHDDAATAASVLRATPADAEETWISAAANGRYQYAHATAQAPVASRMRFLARTHTLEIVSGELDVEVDPEVHQPFRVRTPSFWVDVLGTGFHVTMDAVEVRHGRVRVVARDGQVLAADLRAGDVWRLSRGVDAMVIPATDLAARGHSARAALPRSQTRQARVILSEARAALAAGAVAQARTLVADAVSRMPRRIDRAEAETLRAECALVDRDLALAQRLYVAVSARYGDLPAGENALFAAAKLARRRDDGVGSAALVQRYLERYPQGRFAAEASTMRAR